MAYRELVREPADQWEITVGLVSGYGYAKNPLARIAFFVFLGLVKLVPMGEYLRDQIEALTGHWTVVRAFNTWRMERAKAGRPFITGFVEFKDVLYTSKKMTAWFTGGAGGEKVKWISASEPVAVLSGTRNPLHDRDEEAYRDCVMDLAKLLGARFRQSRVYVTVLGETIILQDNEIGRG